MIPFEPLIWLFFNKGNLFPITLFSAYYTVLGVFHGFVEHVSVPE